MTRDLLIHAVVLSGIFWLITAAATGVLAKEPYVILMIGMGTHIIGSFLGSYEHQNRAGAILAGFFGGHIGGLVGSIFIFNLIDPQDAISLELSELPLGISLAIVVGGFAGGMIGRLVNNAMTLITKNINDSASYKAIEKLFSRRIVGSPVMTKPDVWLILFGGAVGTMFGKVIADVFTFDLLVSQLVVGFVGIALATILRERIVLVFSSFERTDGLVNSGLLPRTQLRKSAEGQLIAGVAKGISKRFGWNVIVLRALFVIFSLFLGFGFVAYIIGWFLMSDEMEAPGEQANFQRLVWLVDARVQWRVLVTGLPIGLIIIAFGVVSLPSIAFQWATFGIATFPWDRESESLALIGLGMLTFVSATYTGYKTRWLEEPIGLLSRGAGTLAMILSIIGGSIIAAVVLLWVIFVTVIIMFAIFMFKVIFSRDDDKHQ